MRESRLACILRYPFVRRLALEYYCKVLSLRLADAPPPHGQKYNPGSSRAV
jgi:hypothetical protein